MTSAFSWQISISLSPGSFCTPRPNLPVTLGISWCPTFAFQSPITGVGVTNSLTMVVQTVKNPPSMGETWVWSLCWEDPLEEIRAPHSNILAWRIPSDWDVWAGYSPGDCKSQTRMSDWTTTQWCIWNILLIEIIGVNLKNILRERSQSCTSTFQITILQNSKKDVLFFIGDWIQKQEVKRYLE